MNWKVFNSLLENSSEVVSKAIEHNKKSTFNYLESNYHNHIRDLLALTIAMYKKKCDRVKILDFGSNIATWCNMSNKIDVKNLEVYIFDPFTDIEKKVYDEFNFSLIKFNNMNFFRKESFDIIQYGSVAQYDPNFFSETIFNLIPRGNFHSFTHTPITTKLEFTDIQPIHGYERYYHCFDKIINIFSNKNYGLIFKSQLPLEFAKIQEDINEDLKKSCHYANFLFRKK